MHTTDYRLLHYFVEIVGQRSLSRAAKRLNVSVPVVSQALTDLERRLRTTLVLRGPRKFALTLAGQTLLEDARHMQLSAHRGINRFEEYDQSVRIRFKLTLPSELSISWLPGLLGAFHKSCPNVLIDVHVDDHRLNLQTTDIDLALRVTFVETPPTSRPPMTMPLELVRPPPNNRLPIEKQLQRLPLIGFSVRESGDTLFTRHKRSGELKRIQVTSSFSVNHGCTAAELVKQGLGIALVLESTALKGFEEQSLASVSKMLSYGWVRIEPMFRDALPNIGARLFVDFLETGAQETET